MLSDTLVNYECSRTVAWLEQQEGVLFFKRHSRTQNQRKDNKCLCRQQGSFSVSEAGWGGQLFHHHALLWSDGSTLTCFQVQHNRIYKRKAGGEHLCVWFNVEGLNVNWTVGSFTTHRCKSPLSNKQARQKNKPSKARGTGRGSGRSSNPESQKTTRLRIIDPSFQVRLGKESSAWY